MSVEERNNVQRPEPRLTAVAWPSGCSAQPSAVRQEIRPLQRPGYDATRAGQQPGRRRQGRVSWAGSRSSKRSRPSFSGAGPEQNAGRLERMPPEPSERLSTTIYAYIYASPAASCASC